LATTNSTPSSPASIMLLTALPPAPPTPSTERGTRTANSSPSSPICGTATTSVPVFDIAKRRTVESLDSLGGGNRRCQHARQIGGDMTAAQRHDIGMHERAFQEHGDRGDAAAHVDDGGAELQFVGGQVAESPLA
jgi:hypothetical protein